MRTRTTGLFVLLGSFFALFCIWKFLHPQSIPAAMLVQSSSAPYSLFVAPIAFATVYGPKDNLWYLRELVGSLHRCRHSGKPVALFLVVGLEGVAEASREEINLWQWVEYMDVRQLIMGHHLDKASDLDNETLSLFILNYLTRRYGHGVLIDLRTVLKRDVGISVLASALNQKGEIAVKSPSGVLKAEGYTRSSFVNRFPDFPQKRLFPLDIDASPRRTPEFSEGMAKFYLADSFPKAINHEGGTQNFCHLALRPETLYSPLFLANNPASGPKFSAGKRSICFGIPTKNLSSNSSVLLSTFLTHMLPTVEAGEWEKFEFALYIGYDHGDPLLDGNTKVKNKFMEDYGELLSSRQIQLNLIRLPSCKWLSYLWNVLFVAAMRDGCDYFYQANDDITMTGPGWATAFTSALEKTSGLGVAGHCDELWKCTLLTQAFVSRVHFEIFGYFFPLQIRDWYTDNWISTVYGPINTFCYRAYRLKNGSSGRRYTQCDQPLWREAVVEAQKRVLEWKRSRPHQGIGMTQHHP